MIVIKSEKVRNLLRFLIPTVLIPGLILLGAAVFDQKKYAVISFGITLLALCLFIAGFEQKKTGSRRLVLTAVMTVLAVIGRFIPMVKPVSAIVILTGVYLGGEAGFLSGALAALVSNIYFGQGPWTPFQMFSLGICGLLAGLFSGVLKRGRVWILLAGGIAGILYSFLMDVWTVLYMTGSFSSEAYLAALAAAVPYTILYSAGNVFFLMLLKKPFGEKLERIRINYDV